MLSVPSSWTKYDYERATKIMFERFNVPHLYISEQPLMALFGVNATTGIVLDVGHTTTCK